MPRARRYYLDGGCYHITHRCHQRQFLFKFAKYRRLYLETLREAVHRYKVDVLNYVVTSNHIHVLLWARRGREIPAAVQFVHGRVAQAYNRKKKRNGAFWTDRHHGTLIQDGHHLSRCFFYIDFNMLRAGVVEHPAEWDISGSRELLGLRQRYRVINRERLLKCLGVSDWERFDVWYRRTLEQKIQQRYHVREPFWGEAMAVGDPDWLETVADRVSSRKRKAIMPAPDVDSFSVAESRPAYYLAARRDKGKG